AGNPRREPATPGASRTLPAQAGNPRRKPDTPGEAGSGCTALSGEVGGSARRGCGEERSDEAGARGVRGVGCITHTQPNRDFTSAHLTTRACRSLLLCVVRGVGMDRAVEDLTARARIRDAAIKLFGERGIEGAS